jgi:hypothetical protein
MKRVIEAFGLAPVRQPACSQAVTQIRTRPAPRPRGVPRRGPRTQPAPDPARKPALRLEQQSRRFPSPRASERACPRAQSRPSFPRRLLRVADRGSPARIGKRYVASPTIVSHLIGVNEGRFSADFAWLRESSIHTRPTRLPVSAYGYPLRTWPACWLGLANDSEAGQARRL